MRRIFSLCFSEITLETPRNDARIFERNFVESSQGQRTKFVHFALITFSQYCISKRRHIRKRCLRPASLGAFAEVFIFPAENETRYPVFYRHDVIISSSSVLKLPYAMNCNRPPTEWNSKHTRLQWRAEITVGLSRILLSAVSAGFTFIKRFGVRLLESNSNAATREITVTIAMLLPRPSSFEAVLPTL